MPITDEEIAQAKADHPGVDLHLLTNPDTGDQILCKAPNDAQYKAFMDTTTTAGRFSERLVACRKFVAECLVVPTASAFAVTWNDKPALASTFADELREIAGASAKATHRKV